MADKFPMPGTSWEGVKKIIQAYGAAHDDENPTVESVANLAGMHRPKVSQNNNFLREIGVLLPDQYKLTPVGVQLSTGLSLQNWEMATEALQQIVSESPFFSRMLNILKARGSMKPDAFKGQMILEAGLNANSSSLPYVRTLMDLMNDSELINFGEEGVSLRAGTIPVINKHKSEDNGNGEKGGEVEDEQLLNKGKRLRMPIPLSPNRVAYIELPADWNSRERGKLIKLLELALGDDIEP